MESSPEIVLDRIVVRTQPQGRYDQQSSQSRISKPEEVDSQGFHGKESSEYPIRESIEVDTQGHRNEQSQPPVVESLEVGPQTNQDLRESSPPAKIPSHSELRKQIRQYVTLYRAFTTSPMHRSKCHSVARKIQEILQKHPSATLFLCECLREQVRRVRGHKERIRHGDMFHASEVLLFSLATGMNQCPRHHLHSRFAYPYGCEQGVLRGTDKELFSDTDDEGSPDTQLSSSPQGPIHPMRSPSRTPLQDRKVLQSQQSTEVLDEWVPCGWPSVEQSGR
ncbi:hypothetical protein GGR57DRAFT_501225 [Xylariaceae sp. FL1272]|nr:hypothetical protein GGR57DRAFT_501225 [Xylariaceae sp. FL1272]